LSGLRCGLSGSVGRLGLRRVILQLRLLSMDQIMPLKLPRYMFRRANGSFRYKRNVPKDLRTMIHKATVYRQLGNIYQDALWALPKVHAEIEALFDLERRTTDEHRARELVRERLGERHQSMFIEGAVDPECPEFDDFQELVEDVEHAVPSVDIPTPRSSATCLRLSPLVSAIRTASLRNSSVRVSIIVHLLCCSKCYQRSGIKPRQVQASADELT